MASRKESNPPLTASRSVTMKDVARQAGVSRALVSLVLRDMPGASEATRERVQAVAKQMGYRPDRRARSLGRVSSGLLGVTFGLKATFHGDLVEALYGAAAPTDYDLTLSGIGPTREEQHAVQALLDYRCEGLILLGPVLSSTKLREVASLVPMVVVARRVKGAGVGMVRTDDRDGIRQAVEHLSSLGHRDIALIDGGSAPSSAERRSGYRSTMKALGLGGRMREVHGGTSEEDGTKAAEEILRSGSLPTAIAVFNDRCALGVLFTLWDAGVRVPEDVSIVGYDDNRLAALAHVNLTTVRQDSRRMAELAVSSVTSLIGDPYSPEDLVVPPSLVVRGTTGPARVVSSVARRSGK